MLIFPRKEREWLRIQTSNGFLRLKINSILLLQVRYLLELHHWIIHNNRKKVVSVISEWFKKRIPQRSSEVLEMVLYPLVIEWVNLIQRIFIWIITLKSSKIHKRIMSDRIRKDTLIFNIPLLYETTTSPRNLNKSNRKPSRNNLFKEEKNELKV